MIWGLLFILKSPWALRNSKICLIIDNNSVNILKTFLCARHHILFHWILTLILCNMNSSYDFYFNMRKWDLETLSDLSEATYLWNGETRIGTLAIGLQSEFLKEIWWPPTGKTPRENRLKNSTRGYRIHGTDLQRSWLMEVSVTMCIQAVPKCTKCWNIQRKRGNVSSKDQISIDQSFPSKQVLRLCWAEIFKTPSLSHSDPFKGP